MYADDIKLSSTINSFSDINSNTNADVLINIELGKVIEPVTGKPTYHLML